MPMRRTADCLMSVPGGSQITTADRFAQVKTQMKGGIKNNGKESQGRKEEGWQEALSRTL